MIKNFESTPLFFEINQFGNFYPHNLKLTIYLLTPLKMRYKAKNTGTLRKNDFRKLIALFDANGHEFDTLQLSHEKDSELAWRLY
jgi:hypothetical protein